nr:isoform 2 of methylsterol monooxygenase 2-2 [Quercus suber]
MLLLIRFTKRYLRWIGSDIHNDLKLTLEYFDELDRLKLANALVEAFDICTLVSGRDRQSGGSQGGRRCGGGRASCDCGRTSRCTPDAGTGPSHTASHEGTFPAQTTSRGASIDYEDPPRMSPPIFSGSAHDGECIFVPTPSMPTPPLVHDKIKEFAYMCLWWVQENNNKTKNNSPATQEKCITCLLLYHFGVNLLVMLLSYPDFKFMGMRSSLPLPSC